MIDYYGTDADYIHLKFGEMQKMYNFTEKFVKKYPNFCAEYKKYWAGDETCRFKNPLQIAQYIDRYDIPVRLYFNYTDTPVKNMAEVYEYLIREYTGKTSYNLDGTFRQDWDNGLDGETNNQKEYRVTEV